MAAATTLTQKDFSALAGRVGALESERAETAKRLDIAAGLLKALEAPASRAGVSPAELIQRMTAGGQSPAVIASDGTVMPVPGFSRYRGGAINNRGIGMGKMLGAMVGIQDPRLAPENRAALEKSLFDPPERGGFGVRKAALAENTGTTGGYTVPPQFVNQLLTLAIEESIVRPRATAMPMASLTMQVPTLDVTTVRSSGTTPILGGIVGTWTAEGTTRTETEPTFKQIELKAHELSFYTVASNTLLADNAVGLDSLLTQLFTMAIAYYTDYAYLQGNGVGKPLGILNASATIAVTRNTSGRFKYADAATMMSKLYWLLRENAAWVVSPTVIPELLQMTDPAGRVIFIPLSGGAQAPIPQSAMGVQSVGSLFGLPVLVSDKLSALGSAGDVLLADFSKYLLGDRMELQIDVSPHVKFLTNQMTWRVIWRGDGQPWLSSYITLQDTTTTVSPFVRLAA